MNEPVLSKTDSSLRGGHPNSGAVLSESRPKKEEGRAKRALENEGGARGGFGFWVPASRSISEREKLSPYQLLHACQAGKQAQAA